MKSVLFLFLLIFFASSAPATVVIPHSLCPDQFLGRVASIIEPSVDSAFATNKVIFTNVKLISGSLGESVFINILKNGLVKPRVGELYQLSTRKGVLCSIEKFDH